MCGGDQVLVLPGRNFPGLEVELGPADRDASPPRGAQPRGEHRIGVEAVEHDGVVEVPVARDELGELQLQTGQGGAEHDRVGPRADEVAERAPGLHQRRRGALRTERRAPGLGRGRAQRGDNRTDDRLGLDGAQRAVQARRPRRKREIQPAQACHVQIGAESACRHRPHPNAPVSQLCQTEGVTEHTPTEPRQPSDASTPAGSSAEVVSPSQSDPDQTGDSGKPDEVSSMVEQPAKVMRIGTMIKQLLEEVRAAPLDEAGRQRLREIHEISIHELEDGLSPELRDELERLTLPFGSDVPSEAELRIAQAQLVGWLEGLFHGIQTALFAQQMAARAQLEQMRHRALPGGSGPSS